MIFPSDCHLRKLRLYQILYDPHGKLNGKEAQGNSTDDVYPAEEARRNEFAPPCDQPCHEKAPNDRAAQKASEEDREMYRLRTAG